jgi:cyclophilin family peptidyl-prolyl cis-trans isomerase
MRLFNIIFTFLLLFIIGCKNNNNENTEQKIINNLNVESKQIIKKEIETTVKDADSINNKNTVAFLKKYGALNKENKVLIKTRLGDITLKLYDDTPLHRASFIFLVKVGYFDTTCFYRVVPDFIIQGGESERLDTQNYKAKYLRYKLPNEFRKNRKHKYGALASAREWKNNPYKKSTPFEFYIVQSKKRSTSPRW